MWKEAEVALFEVRAQNFPGKKIDVSDKIRSKHIAKWSRHFVPLKHLSNFKALHPERINT